MIGGRLKKPMIVALARKLLIALWKYMTAGVLIREDQRTRRFQVQGQRAENGSLGLITGKVMQHLDQVAASKRSSGEDHRRRQGPPLSGPRDPPRSDGQWRGPSWGGIDRRLQSAIAVPSFPP